MVVEEERRAVTDQKVRHVAALCPVVAGTADDRVEAIAAEGEVVARAGEGLVGVGATVGEVAAVAALDDVIADATVESVVAGPALQDVDTAEVVDDVVAVATEGDVVAGAAVDDVIALVAEERVVVVAAIDLVDCGSSVEHALAVDAWRIDAVRRPVADLAIGHADQQCVLVAFTGRVVDDARAGDRSGDAGRVAELELAVGSGERVGLQTSEPSCCASSSRRTSCLRAGCAGSCPAYGSR